MTINKMPKVGERYIKKAYNDPTPYIIIATYSDLVIFAPEDEADGMTENEFPDNIDWLFTLRLRDFLFRYEPYVLVQPSIPANATASRKDNPGLFCSYCGGSGGTMLLSNPPQWQPCFKCSSPVKEERLPEVGKLYKAIKEMPQLKIGEEIKIIEIPNNPFPFMPAVLHFEYNGQLWKGEILGNFWDNFEEIPNNSQKPSEVQVSNYVTPEIIRYSVRRIKLLATTRIPNYELPADSFIEDAIKDIFSEYFNSKKDKEMQAKESVLSDEVREAMESLAKKINYCLESKKEEPDYHLARILSDSTNLLNALEAMVESDIPEKSKSIWRDVIELPSNGQEVLIKFKNTNSIKLCAIWDNDFKEIGNRFTEDSKYNLSDVRQWCYLADFVNHIDSLEQRIKKLEAIS